MVFRYTGGELINNGMTGKRNIEDSEKAKIVAETAKIPWTDLQRWFASGSAIYVAGDLDLIEVAWQMSQDNKRAVAQWMESGQVGLVSDQQAVDWLKEDALLWAAVIKPWVLVQLVPAEQ